MTAIPTPDDLDRAPELAILAALDATLQAAIFAVIAQQPGLRGPDQADGQSLPGSHWIATVLVALASDLLLAVDAYRQVLAVEHAQRLRASEDYPF